jgi:uncharacterized protein YdeI (BOF family)
MEIKKVIKLLLGELKNKCYINISDFLDENNLDDVKTKDLIKAIKRVHQQKMLLDKEEELIYSYNLVYSYCKEKFFESLANQIEIDLTSDDFENFKPEDIIRIFCNIDRDFFDFLISIIQEK